MAKRPSQFDGDVAQARRQKTAETRDYQGEEESNMRMDVVPTQGHPHTEIQLGLSSSDPSTSQMKSHDESAVPGIHASEMVVDRWTLAEHSAFDRDIKGVFPWLSTAQDGQIMPCIIRSIALQNDQKMSLGDAEKLLQRNQWLRDPLIACREKGSYRDIRRLSECLLCTFPVNKFS
jgi:hypothetical protein